MGNCGCVSKAPEEQELDMDEQLIPETPKNDSRPSVAPTNDIPIKKSKTNNISSINTHNNRQKPKKPRKNSKNGKKHEQNGHLYVPHKNGHKNGHKIPTKHSRDRGRENKSKKISTMDDTDSLNKSNTIFSISTMSNLRDITDQHNDEQIQQTATELLDTTLLGQNSLPMNMNRPKIINNNTDETPTFASDSMVQELQKRKHYRENSFGNIKDDEHLRHTSILSSNEFINGTGKPRLSSTDVISYRKDTDEFYDPRHLTVNDNDIDGRYRGLSRTNQNITDNGSERGSIFSEPRKSDIFDLKKARSITPQPEPTDYIHQPFPTHIANNKRSSNIRKKPPRMLGPIQSVPESTFTNDIDIDHPLPVPLGTNISTNISISYNTSHVGTPKPMTLYEPSPRSNVDITQLDPQTLNLDI